MPPRTALTDAQRAQLISDYVSGMGATRVARRYHMGVLRVETLLSTAGVWRPPAVPQRRGAEWAPEPDAPSTHMEPTTRPCLRCDGAFDSTGRHHRLCQTCRDDSIPFVDDVVIHAPKMVWWEENEP